VAKEISLEDIRLGLDKMPERFFEHPATVLVMTNLTYVDAPGLMPSDPERAASLNWQEVRLAGSASHDFRIGTSTLFAAWNAVTYVNQIEDERIEAVVRDSRYVEVTQDRVLDGTGRGMSLDVEGSQPAVPSSGDEQPFRAAEQVALLDGDRPARRRRFALVGGGVLVAASPVAVAAGLLVPGFAALGLGALLLLLPPVQRARRHRSPLRVVSTPAAAGGRGVVALASGSVRVGARTFKAVEHFAANEGRDGAVRIGRASADGAAAVGRAASVGGSRGWSAVELVALGIWRGFSAATLSLAREARSTSIRASERGGPLLRGAWAACLAGSRRAVYELAALARSASEQLSALIDSRSGPRQLGSLPPRAPRRPPARGSTEPARRTPAVRPGSRTRSGRRRRSPP
jgi:hypothetical protein